MPFATVPSESSPAEFCWAKLEPDIVMTWPSLSRITVAAPPVSVLTVKDTALRMFPAAMLKSTLSPSLRRAALPLMSQPPRLMRPKPVALAKVTEAP